MLSHSGANIATAMLVKLLESRPTPSTTKPSTSSSQPPSTIPFYPPPPVALVFAYAALSFHFTSWMPSSDLRVLRSESHPDVATLLKQKSHLEHRSPLSVVQDLETRAEGSDRKRPVVQRRRKRTGSWGRGLVSNLPGSKSFASLRRAGYDDLEDGGGEGGMEEVEVKDVRDKSLSERVLYWTQDEEGEKERLKRQEELGKQVEKHVGLKLSEEEKKDGVLENTRLAMTSRTAFFNGERGVYSNAPSIPGN